MLSYSVDDSIKINGYSAVIYALSYNNPLHDIDYISKSLQVKTLAPGYILFDLLLSNGVNFNRFVEGFFNGEKIIFDSLNIVKLYNQQELQAINSYYSRHPGILDAGVLSSSEQIYFLNQH